MEWVEVCPQEELNLRLGLRRAALYPLSYGDKSKLLGFCRATYLISIIFPPLLKA